MPAILEPNESPLRMAASHYMKGANFLCAAGSLQGGLQGGFRTASDADHTAGYLTRLRRVSPLRLGLQKTGTVGEKQCGVDFVFAAHRGEDGLVFGVGLNDLADLQVAQQVAILGQLATHQFPAQWHNTHCHARKSSASQLELFLRTSAHRCWTRCIRYCIQSSLPPSQNL
jgi:hypothetical protein